MKQKLLIAHIGLIVLLRGEFLSLPAQAALPVIDPSNLVHNITIALESVAQTKKQIEQYKTQLQQYKNMLQNTLKPEVTVWAQAQTTISQLLNAVDTLNVHQRELGGLHATMEKFQDVAYYRASPYGSSGGCSEGDYKKLADKRQVASASQKKANDGLVKVLGQQQTTLRNDAKTLQQLQSKAHGAKGQLQAIGYANQLASQQIYQLLQIRGLLIAQQNALGVQMQVQNDKAALEAAASEQFLQKRYRPSPPCSW